MSRIRVWFFADSSPQQLALLRIMLALLAILILSRFQTEASFHFSDNGWFPRWYPSWFHPQPGRWSPLFWSGDPAFVQGFFICSTIISLFLLVGFCTPLAGPLTCLAILSVRARNMALTDGSEFVLQIALMYLSFTDSGQVWSLDRLLNLRDKVWKNFLPFLSRSSWPLRMIQLHLLIIYFVAGTSKIIAAQFLDGSFLSVILMNKNFSRWDLGFLDGSVIFILLSKVITWLIPIWECSLPILSLRRKTVKFAIVSGLLLHLGICIFLKISYFPLVMMACYIAFLPASLFSELYEKAATRIMSVGIKVS